MTTFEELWQGQPAPVDEAMVALREFELAMLERVLQRVGKPLDEQGSQRLRRIALGRYVIAGKMRRDAASPEFDGADYWLSFKSFSSRPYDKIVINPWNQVRSEAPWGLGIMVHYQSEPGLGVRLSSVDVGLHVWSLFDEQGGRTGSYSAGSRTPARTWSYTEHGGAYEPTQNVCSQLGLGVERLVNPHDNHLMLGHPFTPANTTADDLMNACVNILAGLWDTVPMGQFPETWKVDTTMTNETTPTPTNLPAKLARKLANLGYFYTPEQIGVFYAALKTKGFVILAGPTGTGKTRLAQEFARELFPGESEECFHMEAVRPDWRDSTSLLGYYNPFGEKYQPTAVLRFLLSACQAYERSVGTTARSTLVERYHAPLMQKWHADYHKAIERVRSMDVHTLTHEDLQWLWHQYDNGITQVGQAATLHVDDDVLREATVILADQSKGLGVRYAEAMRLLEEHGDHRPWTRTLRALAALNPETVPSLATRDSLQVAFDRLHINAPKRLVKKVVLGIEPPEVFDSVLKQLADKLRDTAREYGLPADDPATRSIVGWLIVAAKEGASEATVTGPATPYILVLDEMNLARVEYYFADILSAMESSRYDNGELVGYAREAINLHDVGDDVKADDGMVIPRSLHLPPNLYIVGTVNMDETTFAFSPKVLDRAFTVMLDEVDLQGYVAHLTETAAAREQLADASAGEQRMAADNPQEDADDTARWLHSFTRNGRYAVVDKHLIMAAVPQQRGVAERLVQLNENLRPYHREFGYRVMDEVIAFVHNATEDDAALAPRDAFDHAVVAKILPKLHGLTADAQEVLAVISAWAADLPVTKQRVERMVKRLGQTGIVEWF